MQEKKINRSKKENERGERKKERGFSGRNLGLKHNLTHSLTQKNTFILSDLG